MADGSPPTGANYQTARLGVGRHSGPGPVVCIMELASMLAGERFSDHPVSVCPIIGALLRAYNDDVDRSRRPDLYRYAAESVGTRGSFDLQRERARAALEWASVSYAQRARAWHRRQLAPRPDHGPDEIAFYVLRSLRGRHTDESHASMLELLDELIAMGVREEAVERRPPAPEPVACRPAAPEPVECRPAGPEPVALAASSRRSDRTALRVG